MDQLEKIKLQTIERYSKRYRELGTNIQTLGWGSEQQQQYRFLQTLDFIDLNNKHILDIGCGFGDYYKFLKSQNIQIKKYTGWDINPDLILEAQKKNIGDPEAKFEVVDIFDPKFEFKENYDVVVMLGVLNFNLKESYNNYEYSKKMISKALSISTVGIIADFLSTRLTTTYPKEDFVFYHDPKVMLEYGLSLSSNVIIKHDYEPIPQKEFMLFIFKN